MTGAWLGHTNVLFKSTTHKYKITRMIHVLDRQSVFKSYHCTNDAVVAKYMLMLVL